MRVGVRRSWSGYGNVGVSPVIAVAVGVIVADEPFGTAEAVGMATMLAATALSLTEPRKVPAQA